MSVDAWRLQRHIAELDKNGCSSPHTERVKRLAALVAEISQKQDALYDAMRKEYPLDATVRVTQSTKKFEGKVVTYDMRRLRIGVKNLSTGQVTRNSFKNVEVAPT